MVNLCNYSPCICICASVYPWAFVAKRFDTRHDLWCLCTAEVPVVLCSDTVSMLLRLSPPHGRPTMLWALTCSVHLAVVWNLVAFWNPLVCVSLHSPVLSSAFLSYLNPLLWYPALILTPTTKTFNLSPKQITKTYIWHIIVSSLSLLLLQLDGNTSDGPLLNTSHQMSHKPVLNHIIIVHWKKCTSNPAILFRSGLLGIIAISSHTLLLVWKSRVSRV